MSSTLSFCFPRLPRRSAGASFSLLVLLAAGSALGTGQSHMADRQTPLFADDIRRLSTLQEDAVRGGLDGLELQKSLAMDISAKLATAPENVLLQEQSFERIIKFVLSGGDPATLRRIREQCKCGPERQSLIDGTLAYARGDTTSAEQLLSRVSHRKLSPILAGHVALVRAVIALSSDRLQAFQLADEARMLSPGTLVDETAHRLIIELSVTHDDRAQFMKTALRYVLRFPKSIYVRDLDGKMARYIAEKDLGQSADGQAWLSQIAAHLPHIRRAMVISRVAELALTSGKIKTAEFAARMAMSVSEQEPTAQAKAKVIAAATMISDQRRVEASGLLDAARNDASPEVLELMSAVRAIMNAIEGEPRKPPVSLRSGEAWSPKEGATETPYDGTIKRTRDYLSSIDDLIIEASL